MEAFKLIGISHGGKLTVSVPEEYDEKELELMIVSAKDINDKDEESEPDKAEEKEKDEF